MTGRDTGERHRVSTPLELLFDLTLAIAFGQAGAQMAKLLEHGHDLHAMVAFVFAVFAISWAWINYTWQASAFDNDGVFFRVATLIQMVGVLVIALGLPQLFHSIDAGREIDTRVVVGGYVVMRLGIIAVWIRAARHDAARRGPALTYAALWRPWSQRVAGQALSAPPAASCSAICRWMSSMSSSRTAVIT